MAVAGLRGLSPQSGLLRGRLREVHATESERCVAPGRAEVVDGGVELGADRRAVAVGYLSQMIAVTPATCGVAIDVPDSVVYDVSLEL